MTEQYNSRIDRPEEEGPSVGYVVVFLLGVAIIFLLGILVATIVFHFFEIPKLKEKAYAEVEAEFAERYKDDIWFVNKSKEFKLPPYTTEEAFCEARGHCGPARPTLMAMIENARKKFKLLLKDYSHNEVMWKYCEKQADEMWKDIISYTEAGKAGLCLELNADLADDLEGCSRVVDDLRGEYRTDWAMVEWCKENCKIPSKQELLVEDSRKLEKIKELVKIWKDGKDFKKKLLAPDMLAVPPISTKGALFAIKEILEEEEK